MIDNETARIEDNNRKGFFMKSMKAMRRTHLLVILIGVIAIGIFTADAAAMYHPGMGRFMQRDPGAGNQHRIGAGGAAAATGRFIPRDPTGSNQYADGMNLYQYVQSAPVQHVDPSGLAAWYPDPKTLPNNRLKDAWQTGINREAKAGNNMSAAFMQIFWTPPAKRLFVDGILKYTDGQPFTNQVKRASETQKAISDLLAREFKKHGFDPCKCCGAASGGCVRIPLPAKLTPLSASGSVAYTRSTDLHHAIHNAHITVRAKATDVEVCAIRHTCDWSIEDIDVVVLDTYDFVRGGAGKGAAPNLRFANDLGAELQIRKFAWPFSFRFDFKDTGSGSCGLFYVPGTPSPIL